jgi:putative acyl-CoA dehydrogenase
MIAVVLAGTLLVRHAPSAVADAFCASRLGPDAAAGPGAPFGTLPDGLDLRPVLDRARAAIPG